VFLMAKPDASPACLAFLDYVLSPEGQELIHTNGLIRAK
jgi:ABC-type Fe3+ transport system substrate-binding protein